MKCFFILKNGYPNGQASVARVKSYAKGFKNENIGIEILLPVSSEKYGRKPKNTSSSGYDKNGIFYKYMSGSPLNWIASFIIDGRQTYLIKKSSVQVVLYLQYFPIIPNRFIK